MDEFIAQRKASTPSVAPPALEPRVIAARSSKYTIELHEKYQELGIPRPVFVFESDSTEGWRAKTEFLGKQLRVESACGSKQEAKERLSELCVGVVREMEDAGLLSKAPKAKKASLEKEPVVNYIGQLLEFQRSTGSPQPVYTDFQLGQSYSCEVTIDGHARAFGSRTTFFTSKRAARHHAAGCAVKHFQAAGSWPEHATDLGGIKKKKPSVASVLNPSPSLSSKVDVDAATGSSSPTQLVAHLATQLSLSTPEWRFSPSEAAAPGFHTVACYFKGGGPHEGPLGEVRHVYGKKKAKEECARLVLTYLQEVKKTRLESARAVLRRMRGDTEAVVGRAVGRMGVGEGGVEEVEEEMGKVGEEPSGDEDEDEGFQSAREEVN
ncbi:hypothetical protein BU23DRAFT_463741 [Bimuria novae-zelandiae CBS 107.79]|uniref:DRBM domain-containing protein n=1 Tax=Bimuria novae-zelandiae CBS 107.79 TaxID=1447943 RepID=A0A6A5V8H0_9PLEO|nr:hypothetical protein BU23DRAFT_463741 [Bimuria novae-zelandiae CBS 107.79]